MDIKITENNNSYTYNILEDDKIIHSSNKNNFPFIEKRYSYAWQAYHDAQKLLKQAQFEYKEMYTETIGEPFESKIYDVSAEQQIVDVYIKTLHEIKDEVNGLKGKTEELKKVSKKVEMVLQELDKIRNKLENESDKAKIGSLIVAFRKIKNQLPHEPIRTASRQDDFEEVLYDFGIKTCQAIQDFHPGAICHVEKNDDYYDVIISEVKGEKYQEILRLKINDKINLCDIITIGNLASIYPVHSNMFYQKYWKPIIEKVGHFYIADNDTLILPEKSPLPDLSKNDAVHILVGFNTNTMSDQPISLVFKNPTWFLKEAPCIKTASVQSKYSEQDYLNAIIKCIDPNLKTLYGRSGIVIKIMPLTDRVLLDVDFGRGLDVVRLSESQIEIV